MLEKLVKGRYLSFEEHRHKLTFDRGEFVTQPKTPLRIEQSTTEKVAVPKWDAKANAFATKNDRPQTVQQKQRVSSIAPGENIDKVHRNFQWLSYYPGMISEVTFDNLDVLSGNFSGCWMMVYRKGGTVYVGHVGTKDDPNDELTVAVKNTWNRFARDHQGDLLRGFNPARAWRDEASRPKKIHGDGLARIWGLVTATDLVSVFLYRGDRDWNRYRIADWRVVPSASPHELAAI